MDDIVGLYLAAMDHSSFRGALNGVSTDIISQKQFSETLGSVFGRPTIPMPKKAVELMFGESALLLTEGQKVFPRKAIEDLKYQFKFPTVSEALKDIRRRRGK